MWFMRTNAQMSRTATTATPWPRADGCTA
jgi:hypothetical protein